MNRSQRRATSLLALAAAALILASCRRSDPASHRPNVLLVTIDTLRPDRLRSYDGKVRTPNLDELASWGVWENAVTQALLTAPRMPACSPD